MSSDCTTSSNPVSTRTITDLQIITQTSYQQKQMFPNLFNYHADFPTPLPLLKHVLIIILQKPTRTRTSTT